MRADRLIQALLVLQGRSHITASELAAELEVSVPTARRDLEALLMAGVPLYPTRGRGGGWRLIGGARTDLTGLTQAETTALLGGLAQAAAATPERTQAMRKVMQALPAPFRAGAERVVDATVRDAPWGAIGQDEAPEAIVALQRAVAEGRQVRIAYGDAPDPVDLVPLIVGTRGRIWYAIAAPAGSDGETAHTQRARTYRVDRMRSATVLPGAGSAPVGFDRAAAWEVMVEQVEELRGAVHARVLVHPRAVAALRDRFGAQARVLAEEAGSGPVPMEVRAHRVDALAEQLAGWTDVAEVTAPAELQVALRELGLRIAARYADA